MVLPDGIEEMSKLTNPLEVKVLFLPISIYQVLFPPLLLARQPSKEAVEVMVIDWIETVGVGVAVGFGVGVLVGFLVGVGLLYGSSLGAGVDVANEVGVGVGSSF